MSIKDKLKALNADVQKKTEEANALVKAAVAEVAAAVFADHPQLRSFTVKGYTPGFNDGEPCEFTFSTDYSAVNGLDQDMEECPHTYVAKHAPTKEDWHDGRKWDGTKFVKDGVRGWASACHQSIRDGFAMFTERQIEAAYGTDFVLIFRRKKGGGVSVAKKGYDCGY